MKSFLRRISVVFGAIVALSLSSDAAADHLTYLPIIPDTPLMQRVIASGEHLWCVNDRAAAYPNFVAQLRDVNDQYAARVGIQHRQVAWGTPATTGCQVQHNMILNHPCDGCAAWIFYANWPVVVEYKAELGYTDWRPVFGHELGHGLLGLHEFYKDSGGSIQCLTDRIWTVMSCGTGVRYPQGFDVATGCAMLDPTRTSLTGCGFQPAPPPVCTGDPTCFDGIRWLFPDGGSMDPTTQVFYAPDGREAFGPPAPWGGRYSPLDAAWHPQGGSFYPDSYPRWFVTP